MFCTLKTKPTSRNITRPFINEDCVGPLQQGSGHFFAKLNCWLLLGHAMHRSEAPNKIFGIMPTILREGQRGASLFRATRSLGSLKVGTRTSGLAI